MSRTENDKIDNKGEHCPKVLVIGDVILDRYVSGTCSRISPEAPVPVLCEKTVEYRAGGAANVALNCQASGVSTTLMGITGRDVEASILADQVMSLDAVHFQKEENVPTTVKTRFITDGHQLLRVDRELIDPALGERSFLKYALAQMQKHKGPIILSDYSKHLTTSIPQIVKRQGFQMFIDPKFPDWELYRGAFTITPNLSEYSEAGGSVKNLSEGCQFLREKYGIQNILLTMGAEGIFYSGADDEFEIPASKSEVIDVTGAGDTVIAVFVASITKGFGVEASLEVANSAAGLVCRKVGTTVLDTTSCVKL